MSDAEAGHGAYDAPGGAPFFAFRDEGAYDSGQKCNCQKAVNKDLLDGESSRDPGVRLLEDELDSLGSRTKYLRPTFLNELAERAR